MIIWKVQKMVRKKAEGDLEIQNEYFLRLLTKEKEQSDRKDINL